MASKRYIIHQKEQKNKGKLSGFWTWISPDTLTGHVWWIPECEDPLCSPLWTPLWAQAERPPLPRYPDEPPKKPGRTPVLEPCLSPIAAKKINKKDSGSANSGVAWAVMEPINMCERASPREFVDYVRQFPSTSMEHARQLPGVIQKVKWRGCCMYSFLIPGKPKFKAYQSYQKAQSL